LRSEHSGRLTDVLVHLAGVAPREIKRGLVVVVVWPEDGKRKSDFAECSESVRGDRDCATRWLDFRGGKTYHEAGTSASVLESHKKSIGSRSRKGLWVPPCPRFNVDGLAFQGISSRDGGHKLVECISYRRHILAH
jgi:hypothetical protein